MGVSDGVQPKLGPYKRRHRWVKEVQRANNFPPFPTQAEATAQPGDPAPTMKPLLKGSVETRAFGEGITKFEGFLRGAEEPAARWDKSQLTTLKNSLAGWVAFRILEARAHGHAPNALIDRDLEILRRFTAPGGPTRMVPVKGWHFPQGNVYAGPFFVLEIASRKARNRRVGLVEFVPVADGFSIVTFQGVKGTMATREELGGKEWHHAILEHLEQALGGQARKVKVTVIPGHQPIYATILKEHCGSRVNPFRRKVIPVQTLTETTGALSVNMAHVRNRRRLRSVWQATKARARKTFRRKGR